LHEQRGVATRARVRLVDGAVLIAQGAPVLDLDEPPMP
jgi:hypothetical protein